MSKLSQKKAMRDKISIPSPQHIHPLFSLLKTVRLRVKMMLIWCRKTITRLKDKKKLILSRIRLMFKKMRKCKSIAMMAKFPQ